MKKTSNSIDSTFMTFDGHLYVFRQMLLRIFIVVLLFGILTFYCKNVTFDFILAPSDSNFSTYIWIEQLLIELGFDYHFEQFQIELITTELSGQFMTHLSTSIYTSLLLSSPYILLEFFRFVSPALYKNERKVSWRIGTTMYVMFVIGLLISYYIIFPFSVRFLGTYQVASKVHSTITLDSYMDTFLCLSVVMGLMFQLPVVSYVLSKKDIVAYENLSKYRRHAIILIVTLSAIITPPDILTLLLVSVPLYCLFEISLWIIKTSHR